MPGDAGASRHRFELVNYAARKEVDIVIAQGHSCVAKTLSSEQVQLSIVCPKVAALKTLNSVHKLTKFANMQRYHDITTPYIRMSPLFNVR